MGTVYFYLQSLFYLAAPPKFTFASLEDSMTLKAGQSTAIEIPFCGHPQPKVKWTFNGGKFTDAKRIKDETIYNMTSLTLAKVIRKDTGKYTVTMENEFGKASVSININVLGMYEKSEKYIFRNYKVLSWNTVKIKWEISRSSQM